MGRLNGGPEKSDSDADESSDGATSSGDTWRSRPPIERNREVDGRSTEWSIPEDTGHETGRRERMLTHLIEHLQDAVVEFEHVDGEPIIRNVNRAFVDLFGGDREGVVGTSLNDHVVPDWELESAREIDQRTAAGQICYRQVQRHTADGLRTFLYRGIPYTDSHGTVYGIAVYTDLSRIVRDERRLQVLTRVLRHNLRNEVMSIHGWAGEVREQLVSDGVDPPAALDRVEEAAANLSALTEEAGEIHRTLDIDQLPEDPSVDCVRLLDSVADQFRDSHPHATIETDLPDRQPIAATDRLRPAFAALVENAIVHNSAGTPRVWLTVDAVEPGWIDVCVIDNGPEISATQRELITGDREITSLTHGDGLGLWLVKWTCDLFGGWLRFETRQPEGNRVRMRLPVPSDDA